MILNDPTKLTKLAEILKDMKVYTFIISSIVVTNVYEETDLEEALQKDFAGNRLEHNRGLLVIIIPTIRREDTFICIFLVDEKNKQDMQVDRIFVDDHVFELD